jgi:hypothetical protein
METLICGHRSSSSAGAACPIGLVSGAELAEPMKGLELGAMWFLHLRIPDESFSRSSSRPRKPRNRETANDANVGNQPGMARDGNVEKELPLASFAPLERFKDSGRGNRE